jgi:hypothetical protein
MPATLKKKKPENKPEKPKSKLVPEEAVRQAVFEKLGKPGNLYRVDVSHVGFANADPPDNRFRFNVWCEVTENQYLITDSFYLQVSPEGGIVSSDPKIQKKYDGAEKAADRQKILFKP